MTRLPNGTLRKHDVLHEWLRTATATELPSDALQQARLRAGRILAARAELIPAVRLMLEAHSLDEARSLVLEHASVSTQPATVTSCWSSLPCSPRPCTRSRSFGSGTPMAGCRPGLPLPVKPSVSSGAASTPRPSHLCMARQCSGRSGRQSSWSIDRRLLDLVEETAPVCSRLGAWPEGSRQMVLLARGLAL